MNKRIFTIADCFSFIKNGANIKQDKEKRGYPITRIETTSNNVFNRDKVGYAGIEDITPYQDYVLEDGDLLMSHINSLPYLGRVVYYDRRQDEVIIHGMNLLRLKAIKTRLRPKYATFLFSSIRFKNKILTIAKKSVNQASFSINDLKKVCIELPTVEEQDNIVDKLVGIQKIIQLRNTQLMKLDELVKCRFVEMFGDWKTNPLNLPQISGKELFVFSSGKFLSSDKRKECGVPVYGGNGIAWYTDKPLIQESTIIIGRVGAFCGNIHSTKQPVWITDNAIYIKHCKKEIDHVFLTELMTQMDFHQYADFSGQPKITQKPLEETKYILPTLEQQNAFASFVHRIDKLRFEIQASLDKTQQLFDSLMQEYFG